VGTV
jgi:hypothetical protein